MSHPQIAVIKFLFHGDLKVLNDVLGTDSEIQIDSFGKTSELIPHLVELPGAVIIASLQDKNDLIEIANFLRVGKKVLKQTAIKFVVMNRSGDKVLEEAVLKLGIHDLIEPAINSKMFKFKLDFWIRSLKVQLKKMPSTEGPREEKKELDLHSAVWVEPLVLEDDIWIIRQESDCRRILSKWLVRIQGPSPLISHWTEIKPNLWRFDFKASAEEIFVNGGGAWFYSGEQKPEFVWKENIWLMSGGAFALFYQFDKIRLTRLKSQNKVLTVCKNSIYAQTKESSIVATFENNFTFKQGKLNHSFQLGAKGEAPSRGQNIEVDLSESEYQKNYKYFNSDSVENSLDPLLGKSRTDKSGARVDFNSPEHMAKDYEEASVELNELVSDAIITSLLTQGESQYQCKLDDFFDETIFFTTDMNVIKGSEFLELELSFELLKKKSELKLTGRIENIVENDGVSSVEVKLSAADAASVQVFLNLYEIRQRYINEFMKRAKGL